VTKLESFFYALLYAYVFLGFGYFSNKLINAGTVMRLLVTYNAIIIIILTDFIFRTFMCFTDHSILIIVFT